jgi:hypothetical protein
VLRESNSCGLSAKCSGRGRTTLARWRRISGWIFSELRNFDLKLQHPIAPADDDCTPPYPPRTSAYTLRPYYIPLQYFSSDSLSRDYRANSIAARAFCYLKNTQLNSNGFHSQVCATLHPSRGVVRASMRLPWRERWRSLDDAPTCATLYARP